jgi:hypothetical protein
MIVGRLNPLTLAVTTVSQVEKRKNARCILPTNSIARKAAKREKEAQKAQKHA